MIQVVYDKAKHSLTMDGHANAGPIGHDLVCSAASILAYTLAGNVSYMASLGQVQENETRIDMQNGHTEIACIPVPESAAIVTVVLDAICVGFEMLADTYPQHISYKVIC